MKRRFGAVGLLVSLLVVVLSLQATAPAETNGPQVSRAERHDTSPPLSEMPVRQSARAGERPVLLRTPPHLANRGKPAAADDPVLQSEVTVATPAPLLSFEGLSDDDNASVLGFRVVPPDTNGDVGPSHYVQVINLLLAVFDKSGNLTFGPVPINSLWSGFGGICESNNDGDPVVLYDHLADRWVVSQFALGSDGHQCVAVSASGDPTGSYHRYDFVLSPGAVNDYPKLGVWPDAYYLTANEFAGGFSGVIAVAFERDNMLVGLGAQMVEFGPLACGAECFFSLQPSHLNGVPPPLGTPNTFVMAFDDDVWGTGAGSDGYRLWEFSVDWQAAANSTFLPIPQVSVAEFDSNLCQFNPCIPQPKSGERLDSLSQFTMYRAQLRHFLDYDALVLNHTVDATGRNLAGIRWAELRNTGSGWSLYQTGTYAPDKTHRWLGSAAMDKVGNIALGYSVSSRSVFPSIRYATRSSTDPLGTLGAEVELIAGGGVQQNSFNRWGDYSTMSVDPVDGCTFWYTQEYYANSGRFDFKTRIGAFKVPGCV